nr:cation transporter dimerization domain-containing protein [Paenibacillus frigoriresistens]
MHGNHIFVDVTIHVNGNLNVVESHAITEKIEERMMAEHKITQVLVHIEPLEREY